MPGLKILNRTARRVHVASAYSVQDRISRRAVSRDSDRGLSESQPAGQRSGASGAGVSRAVFASKHISRWHEMNSTSRGMALRE